MPATPFRVHVDEATSMGAAGLDKQTAALTKTLSDGIEVAVTTAGACR